MRLGKLILTMLLGLILASCGESGEALSNEVSESNTESASSEELNVAYYRYEPDGDEAVDLSSGLRWRRGPNNMTWGEAEEWASSLGPGWRLPTISELNGMWAALSEAMNHSDAGDPFLFASPDDETLTSWSCEDEWWGSTHKVMVHTSSVTYLASTSSLGINTYAVHE